MSGKTKKSLGTVVECSESGDTETTATTPDVTATVNSFTSVGSAAAVDARTNTTNKARRRATFGGSRLSLHSLLFSSSKDKEKERYGEENG